MQHASFSGRPYDVSVVYAFPVKFISGVAYDHHAVAMHQEARDLPRVLQRGTVWDAQRHLEMDLCHGGGLPLDEGLLVLVALFGLRGVHE